MKPHEEWIKKAESDLVSAKILLNNKPPILDTSVYHSQQCAEKALKAFLVYKTGIFQKKHDLNFLIGECNVIDSDFSDLFDEADTLSPYDTAYRYPGISSAFEPDYPEGEEAVKFANEILDFVKRKMGI